MKVNFDYGAYGALISFVKRWNKKRFCCDPTSAAFDKFITKYLIFAAEVNVFVIENKRYNSDKYKCTKVPAKFLLYFNNRIIHKLQKHAQELAKIIEEKHFDICSSNGKQPYFVQRWFSPLNDDEDKLIALLETLYYMRCNLFHGHKIYSEYQVDLLKPAIKCLQILSRELMLQYKTLDAIDMERVLNKITL